jgi:hypothetical protein
MTTNTSFDQAERVSLSRAEPVIQHQDNAVPVATRLNGSSLIWRDQK